MLKIATKEDKDIIQSLALNFVNTSPYKDVYSTASIIKLMDQILTGDQTKAIILLHGTDGMIVGVASDFPYGEFKMATELAWWVNEDKRSTGVGKELIDAFEYWAKEVAGCKGITMGSLDQPLDDYYTSRGYTLTERNFVKWLH